MEGLLDIVGMNIEETTSNINKQKLVSFTRETPIHTFFNFDKETYDSLPSATRAKLLLQYYAGMCAKEASKNKYTTTVKSRSIYKDNNLEQKDEMFQVSPSISAVPIEGNKPYFEKNGFFGDIDVGNDPLIKLNTPERTLFYINQAYGSYDSKKEETFYYNDCVVLAQEAALEDEVLTLDSDMITSMYVPVYSNEGKYLEKKTVKGLVTVNLKDTNPYFLDYGYTEGVTPSQQNKSALPSFFSTTAYPNMKSSFKSGTIPKEQSRIFFYVNATIDRNDPSNRFKKDYSSVVRTNIVPYIEFVKLNDNKEFDPSDILSSDKTIRSKAEEVIKKVMKKISEESNNQFVQSEIRSSLKRKADGLTAATSIFGETAKKLKTNINISVPSVPNGGNSSGGGNFYIDE